MTLKKTAAAICAAGMVSLSGCASIVGDTDQQITINSTPSNADVVISDEHSQEVFQGTTPTTVTLKKADGSYFGGKSYTVELSKEGYDSRAISITSAPNGWYIGGNILFGGLIGWLVVDPLTGAMYTLSPDDIDAGLGESVASHDGGKTLNLVLTEDVPQALRKDMRLLGQL